MNDETVDKDLQRKLNSSYEDEIKNKYNTALHNATDEQKKFLKPLLKDRWSYSYTETYPYKKLYNALAGGQYSKPSEFIENELSCIFDGMIFERLKPHLYYAVDNCTECICSGSMWRRSFHSKNYLNYVNYILKTIIEFIEYAKIDKPLTDIFKNRLSAEEQAYKQFHHTFSAYLPAMISYELDNQNNEFQKIIEDVLFYESVETVNDCIIKGIVMSSNKAVHELLGKLLAAARLQEGLRQAICENADAGTLNAFKTILNVIYENNLIRFSSVKRAVGTWLGLISYEINDLERVSNKSVELILQTVDSESERKEFLNSEDSMKIYIALWAYGLHEIENAVDITVELIQNGSHHQILTAGYFLHNIENSSLQHKIAKTALKKYSTEYDITAVYLPYFIYDWYSSKSYNNCVYHDWKKNFDSVEEACEFYDILCNTYSQIKKNSMLFSPCIFPWFSAELTKSDAAVNICIIAGMLKDNDKKDFACSLLKYIKRDNYYSSDKHRCIETLLSDAQTPVQIQTLVSFLGDRDSDSRCSALRIILSGKISLTDENYLQIEDMLRYKSEEIRGNLIDLLCKRDDESLKSSIQRLLSDKKEEKRTAGLDIVMRLNKDENRQELANACKTFVSAIQNPTTQEQILINNILDTQISSKSALSELFDENDVYAPSLPDNEYINSCIELFMQYYPDSDLGHILSPEKYSSAEKPENRQCKTYIQAVEDMKSLDKFITEHENDEFVYTDGETKTISSCGWQFRVKADENGISVPLMSVWNEWYKNNAVTPERILRLTTLLSAYNTAHENNITKFVHNDIENIFGFGFSTYKDFNLKYQSHFNDILDALFKVHNPNGKKQLFSLGIALTVWYIREVPDDKVFFTVSDKTESKNIWIRDKYAHYIGHPQFAMILSEISDYTSDENFNTVFPVIYLAGQKTFSFSNSLKKTQSTMDIDELFYVRNSHYYSNYNFYKLGILEYLSAVHKGIISERLFYKFFFDESHLKDSLSSLTYLVMFIKEREKTVSNGHVPYWNVNRGIGIMKKLIGKTENFSDDDNKMFDLILSVYKTSMNIILPVEFSRGDTDTEFSKYITSINRIYGAEKLVAVLSALGNMTLDRSTYYFGNQISKKYSMSHLLSVCVPEFGDNADKLRELIEKTDITQKRLIETAMYSPEWMEIIAEYLGWEGFVSACYYFIAHMNEYFDEKRTAIIARYTPLTPEQLNDGAFDINWFKEAYSVIGEERFRQIYDSAKYISNGSKHTRARKYADAVLGLMNIDDTEKAIEDKRNKDLLMSYSLIPLTDDNDMVRRYVFLQKFLKQSRQFGSQRMASEKKAVSISLENLALNAGYQDVTRLTLRMESKLVENNKKFFSPYSFEDTLVWLEVDEKGKTSVICEKKGKKLKNIPSKLKNNEYIVEMNEFKKQLTDQLQRTKIMFENAMEEQTAFSFEEISIMLDNPVARQIIKSLVFICGENIGFIENNQLVSADKAVTLKDSDKLTVAHPYNLYKSGKWSEYQKMIFDRGIVQPFRQVFRELYVKTDEEREMLRSLRYAGYQIQPAKTVACLKGRRWVADFEDGLQKVYYKENIVATIYAVADWFSPSDIEAPTLECVVFLDRKTGNRIQISEIPDIIFSEVMRDVDLAVSVAHAGGVDPETSHSTIEMRSALLQFIIPLFNLKNVSVQGTHAHINGKYGDYTVHLGSGIIHKKGGTMINVLAVHSQHRGKIFLPFADNDPKTAEIITKVILFSDDAKIKDPSILSQISE